MADPFATGLGTLFRGPRSVAAVYTPPDGPAQDLMVIHSHPGGESRYGKVALVPGAHIIRIRRVDVAQPVEGAIVAIAPVGELSLIGDLYADETGGVWVCHAELVPA